MAATPMMAGVFMGGGDTSVNKAINREGENLRHCSDDVHRDVSQVQ